jgi:hypothetical protein
LHSPGPGLNLEMMPNESDDGYVRRWIGLDGRAYFSGKKVLGQLRHDGVPQELEDASPKLPVAIKLRVRTPAGSFCSFHVYNGGSEFRPVLPKGKVAPGTTAVVLTEALPLDAFVSSIPPFQLTNSHLVKWFADRTVVESVSIQGPKLRIRLQQDHPLVKIRQFTLAAVLDRYPGRCNQRKGIYLQCHLMDYAGRPFGVRLCHDGLSQPEFEIDRGAGFERVSLISFDGLRLSFRYGIRTTSTLYVVCPSEFVYEIHPPRKYSGDFLKLIRGLYREAASIDSVILKRRLERMMLQHGSSYDLGRIGSEIACLCAVKYLGLGSVVIEEPSKGGKDLYTADRQFALQARMLKETPSRGFKHEIQVELLSLVRKLRQDFAYNPGTIAGYAILSFVDKQNVIKTLLVQVPTSVNSHPVGGGVIEEKPAEGSAPSTPRLRGA